jgi:uncharacterized Zn-binding protein involved in type VI secretion
MVRALSHVLFFSTLVRCGDYRSQTGIQRKLNFVSVRTIKEGSINEDVGGREAARQGTEGSPGTKIHKYRAMREELRL